MSFSRWQIQMATEFRSEKQLASSKDSFNIEEFKAMNYSLKQQKELMKKNYKNYIIIIGKLINYIINKNEIDIDIYELEN